MRNQHILTALGIPYPIVQAPMLGVSTPEMAAAVSNAGGLGSLPVGGLSPDATRDLIHRTKRLTGRPFAVNLFVHEVPPIDEESLKPMWNFLLKLYGRQGYAPERAALSGFRHFTYKEQMGVLAEENIGLISFTFGCPDDEFIRHFHGRNCTLIGTATSSAEAEYLEAKGIDMIALQGIEAGGHRGTFLEDGPLPQIGLFPLLGQVRERSSLPLIAAGAIRSAAGMKAAFALGADAVQIGTAFIGTDESIAIPAYKSRVEHATDSDSMLTRSFSGRWARGLCNKFMAELDAAGIPIPPYPWQNSLTTAFRRLAQQNNDADFTNLWAGQAPGRTIASSAAEIVRILIEDYGKLSEV